jgi:hypothetical protein
VGSLKADPFGGPETPDEGVPTDAALSNDGDPVATGIRCGIDRAAVEEAVKGVVEYTENGKRGESIITNPAERGGKSVAPFGKDRGAAPEKEQLVIEGVAGRAMGRARVPDGFQSLRGQERV